MEIGREGAGVEVEGAEGIDVVGVTGGKEVEIGRAIPAGQDVSVTPMSLRRSTWIRIPEHYLATRCRPSRKLFKKNNVSYLQCRPLHQAGG